MTGVYGVMAYAAQQRTAEIGVRMALGAQGRHVVRLLVRQGAALAVPGVAVGLAAAFATTRLLRSLLFGVGASDAATFAVTAAAVLVAAIAASWIPAFRASRVEAVQALRHE
jgi:ABC-type antimicrobial peptide transport system permease subunit